jgi:hypothetical protein
MLSVTEVENLAKALTSLDLPVQDQPLLMRKSLRAKVAHCAHCGQLHNILEALHTSGLGMALNSAMRVCARIQIPVCPDPPLVFSHELCAGCVLGFWWFPLYDLHVYFSMWREAEALSEYGVVPE